MTASMRALRPALAALAVAVATSASASGRRVVEDDYARALQEARKRGVPIVVDVWAPW
jgi:hypothetical protein